MTKFAVLTFNDRNLVIEAERASHTQGGDYSFTTKGETVASVPDSPNIFAVVNQEAEVADFYFADHQDDDTFAPPVCECECTPEFDDDANDVCLDCRFEEFLDSQEFFNAVADIVCQVLGFNDDDPEGAEVTD